MESGKTWPVHLKPLDDELLSSWMIRLAHVHGLKVMTLCTLLFGYRRPVWNRDIDRLAPKDVLHKLSQITGTPPERVYATTLRELEGKVFEKFNLNGNTHWVLPLGIRSRSHKDYGLQYCPQCLVEDPIPYFRRLWRLGFITVCTKHKTILSDCCDACGAPVMPHRVDMRSRTDYPTERDMLLCASCGMSLLSVDKHRQADGAVVQEQHQWEEAVRTGWINWAGNPSMYSHIFFEGLRVLCSGLVTRKERKRLVSGLKGLKNVAKSIPIRGVEFARIRIRYELMVAVVAQLSEWPDQFLSTMKDISFRYSTLHGYSKYVPYWYESVIEAELKHKYSSVQNEEDRHITQDIYEDLIVSIDHEISATQNKKLRLALLRDKFMFVIGYTLKLGMKKLSVYTIDDIRRLVPQTMKASFYEVPASASQGRAWCEWYLENIRPLLRPAVAERRLFVSARTHTGMSKSLIGYRFNRAVKAALLSREIESYCFFLPRQERS